MCACDTLLFSFLNLLFEELLKVVTHAVAKLNLNWLEEEVSVVRFKLGDQFQLPLFPDLHAMVLRSWKNAYSARLFSPATSNYSSIVELENYGYAAILEDLSPTSHTTVL